MKTLILILMAGICFGQTQTLLGNRTAAPSTTMDFSAAKFTPGVKTVGTLPSAASSTNAVYEVTDGVSASDCTVGSGSTRSLCASTGAAWVSVGGGATTGASLQSLGTITTSPVLDGGSTITAKTIAATLGATISCGAIQNWIGGEFLTLSLTQDGSGSRPFTCAGLSNIGDTSSIPAGKNTKQIFVAVSSSALNAITTMWCVDCDPSIVSVEGIVTPGISASDVLSSVSAIHRWEMNMNNAGALVLVGASTTPATSGNCAKFAANGYDLADALTTCGGTGVTQSGVAGFLFGPVAGGNGSPIAAGVNYGSWRPFIAQNSTIKKLSFLIDTADAGKGLLVGVFDYASSLPSGLTLCSGVDATITGSTGIKVLAFSTGSAFSGGACNLTVGKTYAFVATSDSATLAWDVNFSSFPVQTGLLNADHAHMTDISTAVSTLTGASLAFTPAAGWTGYQTISAFNYPLVGWSN